MSAISDIRMRCDDPYLAALRRERALMYYQEAARPFLKQIADIQAMYGSYRMVISPEGKLLIHEASLPDFAQRLVDQCNDMAKMCADMAVAEAQRFYP